MVRLGQEQRRPTANPLERSFLLQVPWTQLKKRSEIINSAQLENKRGEIVLQPAWKFFSEGSNDGI